MWVVLIYPDNYPDSCINWPRMAEQLGPGHTARQRLGQDWKGKQHDPRLGSYSWCVVGITKQASVERGGMRTELWAHQWHSPDSCLHSFLPCPPAPPAAKLGPVVLARGKLHLLIAFLSSRAETADRPREGPSNPGQWALSIRADGRTAPAPFRNFCRISGYDTRWRSVSRSPGGLAFTNTYWLTFSKCYFN